MNSKEITNALLKDPHARRVFRGVFPRDKLPRSVNVTQPGAYVINTDNSSGPGKHWVCVWFTGLGDAEYFDSFGLPPTEPTIKNFLFRQCSRYKFNQRLLQSLTSSACGFYVLYYVMMKSRGVGLTRIQRVFYVNNLWGNDRRVWSLVQQLIRK